MSFKEEYTELQNKIAPDAEFLEQLELKMERQKQRRKKPVLFVIPTAAVCAGAAALIMFLNLPKPLPKPVYVGAEKFSYTVGLFANKDVFTSGTPVPEQLSQMLSDSETAVYASDENKFDPSGKLNDEQRKAVSEKIRSATETSAEPVKKTEYYMAVPENGDIVKFRISGDILTVNEKFYKIP